MMTSGRWLSARTVRSGSGLGAAWRGSTRTAAGRPTARPTPMAACRTISSSRGARRGRSLWIGTDDGGLARLDKDGHWQTYSRANTKGTTGPRRPGVGARPGRLPLGRNRGGGLARLDKNGRWRT